MGTDMEVHQSTKKRGVGIDDACVQKGQGDRSSV